MKILKQSRRSKRGAALVEYGLIVAGVALVTVAAVAIFGTKIGGMFGTAAAVLPGAHAADNGPIAVGRLTPTTVDANGNQTIDGTAIQNGDNNLGSSVGVDTEILIQQPEQQ